MSQDNLIKLESVGGANGAGKGHIIRTKKNKKNTPARLEVKKYNPIAKAHTIYKETK
jgi:large subunit ribosomal protein L33